MVSVWSIVIGAVVALAGGALSTLLAPWIARQWKQADAAAERLQASDAARRAAVENYLTALWVSDSEYLRTAVAEPGTLSNEIVASAQAVLRTETQVGLLLRRGEAEIATLMRQLSGLVTGRERGINVRWRPTGALRSECGRIFGAWLRGEKTPADAHQEFKDFVEVVWNGDEDQVRRTLDL